MLFSRHNTIVRTGINELSWQENVAHPFSRAADSQPFGGEGVRTQI